MKKESKNPSCKKKKKKVHTTSKNQEQLILEQKFRKPRVLVD